MEKTPVIKTDELAKLLNGQRVPVLVDVRSESDFKKGHLSGAINIPLGELERRAYELDSSTPTVFY